MSLRFVGLLLALGLCCASLFAAVPASNHVVVVVEENHSYSSVINNASMPYLNSLAKKYSLLTNFYANTHPSIGNYFEMTTGQIITNNDSYSGTVNVDNVVRELMLSGKTWKSYAESLPSVGYLGLASGAYVKRHNPLAYFTDVANSSTERARLVPFTQFSKDLASNSLPTFSFVVPNVNNDAHSGSLSTADNWLKNNIGPLLNNPGFKQDGILIIVFDESVTSDTAHGGGHVAALVIGPKVKKGYKSTVLFQQQSLLKTVIDAFRGNPDPGAAPYAPAFDVF
jgi:acid phosphatase